MDRRIIAVIAVFFAAGCAQAIPRGVVAMKTADDEAHVCIRKQEVHEGETVVLYKNVCVRTPGKGARSECDFKRVGTGKITERLSDHYSVVHFESGLKFEEGDVVEVEK